jgi:hypothetical protein
METLNDPQHVGIVGTNREGMRKYRRFPENPEARREGDGRRGVGNGAAPATFRLAAATHRAAFRGRGFRTANAIVTVLSRNAGRFAMILREWRRKYRHFPYQLFLCDALSD